MILVVDVGNTNIVLGIYEGKTLLHHWRLSTNRSATVDEYGIMIHNLFQLCRRWSWIRSKASLSPASFLR